MPVGVNRTRKPVLKTKFDKASFYVERTRAPLGGCCALLWWRSSGVDRTRQPELRKRKQRGEKKYRRLK